MLFAVQIELAMRNDLSTIIDSINIKVVRPNTYNFKIWIDEADKYGKFIDTRLGSSR